MTQTHSQTTLPKSESESEVRKPMLPPQRKQVEMMLGASDKRAMFAEEEPSDKSSIAGLQEILGRKGIL